MRHLWTLLAGVVAAPLTWVLVALGQGGSTRTVTGWVEARSFDTADLIEPAAYLAVAGILLGLLATLRFSPLGSVVAGLLLVAPYGGMFVDPLAVRDAVPSDWEIRGDPIPLRLPLDNGTLLLIGALLVMAAFSAQRWRRWPAPAPAPAVEEPAEEPAQEPANQLTDKPADAPTLESPPGGTDPVAAGSTKRNGDSPWTTPPSRTGSEKPES
jgi:hypothetical protein